MHKGYALAVVGAIAVVAVLALSAQPGSVNLFSNEISTSEVAFMNYITEYRKSYFNKEEYEFRYSIFRYNLEQAEKHNANPDRTYDQGINQFSDLTEEEFSHYLGVVVPEEPQRGPVAEFDGEVAANSDWVAAGYVNAIKDQGSCGSCWAFSAVGAVESRYAVKHGKSSLMRLSEQELVDCSRSYGNNGCGGGWMDNAFNYDIAEKGEIAESSYPYHAKDESCKKTGKSKNDKFTTHRSVSNSDSAVGSALSSGPISIAVYVNGNFQRYRSGIFSDNTCTRQVNHGVILTGAQDGYFNLRNSWGTSWGERGYMRISRSSTNPYGTCNCRQFASYPDGF